MASNFQNLYQQNPQTVAQLNNNQQMMQNTQAMQYQQMQVFPQPVGNVYNLNSFNDINNIPVGPHLSVGLCLNDGMICIKSLQNGAPATLIYRLDAATDTKDSKESNTNLNEEFQKIYGILDNFKEEFQKINTQLKKGGKPEWQL